MSWTDERVELLKKLWMDGLSASQIAAELGGVTRNAVIGKVHRLGLSGRAKTPSSSGAARAKRAPRNTGFSPRPAHNGQRMLPGSHGKIAIAGNGAGNLAEEEILKAPKPLELDLTQLSEQTCKWPIGDPATEDFHFCGHTIKDGSPYCPYHSRLAYQPVADRRRDRRIEAAG